MSDLSQLEASLLKDIAASADEAALEAVRVAALGKKGSLSAELAKLGTLSPDERKTYGAAVNTVKDRVAAALAERKEKLAGASLDAKLASETVDVTLPLRASGVEAGRIHPVTQVTEEIAAIFADLGFAVAEGPDIEDDEHNFTALNFPVGHPAREMHDTFFFPPGANGERKVLRTHTSPVQIRTMRAQQPPIRVIIPGRTYRNDSDQTHTPMFHQVEGLVIDKGAHLGQLKWVLEEFLKAFFEVPDVRLRMRPSFFPFTEPSVEVDIGCSRQGSEIRFGEGNDWMEVLGCGMVHPNVLRNCGIDPDVYQGFAWGMGIDRLAMLKYGMPDLRAFFEADIRWLEHYGFRPLDLPSLIAGISFVKFTLSWLKEHLKTDAGLDVITDALTKVGLEVEGVEDRAKSLAPFITAKVVEAARHPNADKLQVLKVDQGDGNPVQVVCGASNARAGMIGVFAKEGTIPPGTGITLKAGEIRGQKSQGMMVSEKEMGLSAESEGIIEMPGNTPIGKPFAPLMGLDDPVIDMNVTPNRPDCLGVAGVARDLAATELGTLVTTAPKPVRGAFRCPVKVTLDLDDSKLAPAFALRLVRGVKNGPSPEWLQKKLRAVGLRPINALVDVTNFLTIDRARPLHVFDASKVKGDLSVRRAKKGETLTALDGKTYTLDDSMVVIADANGVESLGGIMGGESTGCTDATTDVLIESALWDPFNIAKTGRALGVHSDARHRFERGVDPDFTLPGLELATQLILDLCGGEASEFFLAGEIPDERRAIDFPLAEVKCLTGLELQPSEIKMVLQRLGFAVSGASAVVKVAAPSWRPDIFGKADIVEEVVRIVGLDRVISTPLPKSNSISRAVLTPLQKRARTGRRALAARGLTEALTWSFISKSAAETFGGGKPELALANPIAADLSDMRPSLLPGLITAAQKNADRGFADQALFELGQVFLGDGPNDQRLAAATLRRGAPRHWAGTKQADAFDAKADALALLSALGLPADRVQIVPGGPAWFHPGRSGTLQLGPQNVFGYFGELHPRVLKELGADGPLAAMEIVLDSLPEPKSKPTKTKPVLDASSFQPVSRDFAFVVDRAARAADLIRAVLQTDRKLISTADVFDVYEGKGIPDGKKSVAVAVTLQPRDKTLTDAEIDAVAEKIVAAVTKATGATLRG